MSINFGVLWYSMQYGVLHPTDMISFIHLGWALGSNSFQIFIYHWIINFASPIYLWFFFYHWSFIQERDTNINLDGEEKEELVLALVFVYWYLVQSSDEIRDKQVTLWLELSWERSLQSELLNVLRRVRHYYGWCWWCFICWYHSLIHSFLLSFKWICQSISLASTRSIQKQARQKKKKREKKKGGNSNKSKQAS